MKQKLYLLLFFLVGCGPLAVDFSAALGANQSLEKSIKINQKETPAQTDARVLTWQEFLDILPAFLTPAPTPTPVPAPPLIKSMTLNFVETPVPTPVLFETLQVPSRLIPKSTPKPRPLRPKPTPKPVCDPCANAPYLPSGALDSSVIKE